MDLAFDWGVSSYFGWGVYGLNFALELANDTSVQAMATSQFDPRGIFVDPLRMRALQPFLERTQRGVVPEGAIRLHCLGNGLQTSPEARIGVVFFEDPLSPDAVERAKRLDLIIAGSSWNEAVLRDAGVANVCTILQGVDRSIFHPAPKRGVAPGRFLIFSGGKAEPRKGQDIVVAAFRVFATRHPDAVLVTAWHSPWPQLARGMDLNLQPLADRVIDAGGLPNSLMAPIYRECDVALFPNRAEGGTNLVAMECLACGVPTILSANTGHNDLIAMGLGQPLERQKPSVYRQGWCDSDLEEAIEALETVYRARPPDGPREEIPEWSQTTAAVLAASRQIYGYPAR